jgi:acyl transferase domain-containing protein
MLATNRIPPQANYTAPNPAIHWDEYNMRVPTQIEEFKTRHASGKRLVSLYVRSIFFVRPSLFSCRNSSGLGGSNGHVIAETPPQKVLIKSFPRLNIADTCFRHMHSPFFPRGCQCCSLLRVYLLAAPLPLRRICPTSLRKFPMSFPPCLIFMEDVRGN